MGKRKIKLSKEEAKQAREWEREMSIKNDGLVNPLATWFFAKKASQGMSREKLAHELGVTTTFMASFLNGGYPNIKFKLLDKILKLTGIPYQEMANYLNKAVELNEIELAKKKAEK